MTKLALCMQCLDMITPFRDWRTNPRWRWCQCGTAATRWKDGTTGKIEITSKDGSSGVRVIGLNNGFLTDALLDPPATPSGWRDLHAIQARTVPGTYLFHEVQRACWALVIAPGESGDIAYVDYPPVETTA